jgi:hypothetical protein
MTLSPPRLSSSSRYANLKAKYLLVSKAALMLCYPSLSIQDDFERHQSLLTRERLRFGTEMQ